jgi:hypothetical protein
VGEFEWVGWTVKGARLIKFKNACKGALRFPQDKPALVQATRKGGEFERFEKAAPRLRTPYGRLALAGFGC